MNDLSGEEATIMEIVVANAPVSTREVANALGCSRRAAEMRLRELYADDRLASESIGRELLWWPAEGWPSREAEAGSSEDEDRNG